MAIYTIEIIPLVFILVEKARQVNTITKTAVYADDLSAARVIVFLRKMVE